MTSMPPIVDRALALRERQIKDAGLMFVLMMAVKW